MSYIHYITSEKLDFVTIEKIINEKQEIRLSEESKNNILKWDIQYWDINFMCEKEFI